MQGAIYFPGGSDSDRMEAANGSTSTILTWLGFIKPDQLTSDTFKAICGMGNAANYPPPYIFYMTSGNFVLSVSDEATTVTGGPWTQGKWHGLCLRATPTFAEVLSAPLDTMLLTIASAATSAPSNYGGLFKYGSDNFTFFSGEQGKSAQMGWMFYERILSNEEVMRHFRNPGKIMCRPGPRHFWPMTNSANDGFDRMSLSGGTQLIAQSANMTFVPGPQIEPRIRRRRVIAQATGGFPVYSFMIGG